MVAGSIGTAFVDYGYSFRLGRQEYQSAAFAQGGTAMWRLGVTALIAVLLPAYPLAVFFCLPRRESPLRTSPDNPHGPTRAGRGQTER